MRRTFDFLSSLFLLVLLAPLLALVALMVRLSSSGPALYRAERVGRGGSLFAMLKFRTMVVGADRVGPGITIRDDPRVTPIGRFLRSTKMDELPQLLNVLRGEMSLIGPRAESPQFVKSYSPDQRRLLSVRPGVTGPGQLHYTTDQQERVQDLAVAEEVYVRELLGEKLQRDLEYLDRKGLGTDMRILGQTVAVMVIGLGSGLVRLVRAREVADSAAPDPSRAGKKE